MPKTNAFARQFYNDVVMEYNNAVAMFPSSLIAGIVGFKPEMFFRPSRPFTRHRRLSFNTEKVRRIHGFYDHKMMGMPEYVQFHGNKGLHE